MTKTLDILYKIFAVLWFGMVGFSLAALCVALVQNGILWLAVGVLVCLVLALVFAFIFSFNTWKFYSAQANNELLLDDIDSEIEKPIIKTFKHYQAYCFLTIIVGISSCVFGIWLFDEVRVEVKEATENYWMLVSTVSVLCLFGLFIIQRAIDVWLKVLAHNRMEASSGDLKF